MGNLDLRQISTPALRAELLRRETANNAAPKPLDNIDFASLTSGILAEMENTIQNQSEDEDFKHHVYTAAMEAVYGKAYWSWLNKLTNH